tara:strand:+ start:524 stop:1522 length:999 start_codon:yes stop_codon:yes gene_type:complete
MKSFLTYDLETTFLQKGQKRSAQSLLEIALKTADKHYQRLVNPCSEYNTGEELIQNLEEMKQHPEATLRFWSKLLVEKKCLPSNIKRAQIIKQADAISKLLVRSDLARKQDGKYKTEEWLFALETHGDKLEAAETFLIEHEVDTPKSPIFYSTKEALTGALAFGLNYTWIAHNGKSFDMPIVKGNCERNEIKCEVDFEDSLPMFRRNIENDSYSQPLLYRSIFGKGYKAHHALDDAEALYKLLEHTAKEKNKEVLELFKVKKLPRKIKIQSDLMKIKGVGPKTALKFTQKGIRNRKQLDEWIQAHNKDEFLETFNTLYRYKKLAETLYEAEV